MKRLAIVGVVLVLVLGGAAWGWNAWFHPASDLPLEASLESVEVRPSTQEKPISPPTTEPSENNVSSSAGSATAPAAPNVLKAKILDKGTLAIEARGQRFAEEAYRLEQSQDGRLQLVSQGKIKFKLVFVDSELRYAQTIQWEASLRPLSFTLDMKGPAGFGNRQVQARVTPSSVQILSDGQSDERPVPEQPFLLLAMFSSYSVIPQWLDKYGAVNLEIPVLTIRGSEKNNDRQDGAPLTTRLSLKKIDTIQIQDQKDPARTLMVSRYAATSQTASSFVFIEGTRFIGLLSEPTDAASDRRFFIYRSDLFPTGFTAQAR